MPLRKSAFRRFKQARILGRFLKNFLSSPLRTFSENAGFWVTLQQSQWLGHSGTFWAAVYAKHFSSVSTLNAYKLEDIAICASVLFGLSKEVFFLEDFWKIFLSLPVPFFQKMRVLNDLAKIPIFWPFGNFSSRCLNQNILPCLHFKRELLRR